MRRLAGAAARAASSWAAADAASVRVVRATARPTSQPVHSPNVLAALAAVAMPSARVWRPELPSSTTCTS